MRGLQEERPDYLQWPGWQHGKTCRRPRAKGQEARALRTTSDVHGSTMNTGGVSHEAGFSCFGCL